MALIPGFTVNLSGTDYVVPPLSIRAGKLAQELRLKDFEKLAPSIAKLKELEARGISGDNPIGVDDASDVQAAIEVMRSATSVEQETTITIAHTALQRNYPEITRDEFEDMCSLYQARVIAQRVLAGDVDTKKD